MAKHFFASNHFYHLDMNNRIAAFKKIILVFKRYGIQIMGKRKFDHFYNDLHMDEVFVNGLIFEIEYELKEDLADEYIPYVSSPSSLINAFLQKEAVSS